MKKLSLLFALALATPAFAQDTTPAADASATTTTYPPCSAQVTDQCIETPRTHGHGHQHKMRHHKK
ncbi:MAG: hypothetical protein ABI240_08225 [Sphingomonas sp.]